jgi:hypothetical protein
MLSSFCRIDEHSSHVFGTLYSTSDDEQNRAPSTAELLREKRAARKEKQREVAKQPQTRERTPGFSLSCSFLKFKWPANSSTMADRHSHDALNPCHFPHSRTQIPIGPMLGDHILDLIDRVTTNRPQVHCTPIMTMFLVVAVSITGTTPRRQLTTETETDLDRLLISRKLRRYITVASQTLGIIVTRFQILAMITNDHRNCALCLCCCFAMFRRHRRRRRTSTCSIYGYFPDTAYVSSLLAFYSIACDRVYLLHLVFSTVLVFSTFCAA